MYPQIATSSQNPCFCCFSNCQEQKEKISFGPTLFANTVSPRRCQDSHNILSLERENNAEGDLGRRGKRKKGRTRRKRERNEQKGETGNAICLLRHKVEMSLTLSKLLDNIFRPSPSSKSIRPSKKRKHLKNHNCVGFLNETRFISVRWSQLNYLI